MAPGQAGRHQDGQKMASDRGLEPLGGAVQGEARRGGGATLGLDLGGEALEVAGLQASAEVGQ
jgi:hypothetical protein